MIAGAHRIHFKTLLRVLLLLGGYAAILLLLVFDQRPSSWNKDYVLGEPADRDFFSEQSLKLEDSVTTQALRAQARQSVPAVYRQDTLVTEQTLFESQSFFTLLESNPPEDARGKLLEGLPFFLSEDAFEVLLEARDSRLQEWVTVFLKKHLDQGILSLTEKVEKLNGPSQGIFLVSDDVTGAGEKISIHSLKTPDRILADFESQSRLRFPRDRKLQSALQELMYAWILPNLNYDQTRTTEMRNQAADQVQPQYEIVKKGQMVIRKGTIVDGRMLEKILAAEGAKRSLEMQRKIVGTGLAALLVYLLLVAGCYYFEKKLFLSFSALSLLLLTFIVTLFVNRLILYLPFQFHGYLLPAAVCPIILTLLLGARVGWMGAVMISLLSALQAGLQIEVLLYTLMGGMAVALKAQSLKSRGEFLVLGLLCGLVQFIAIFSVRIVQESTLQMAAETATFGIINGVFLVIGLAFLVLPVLEHLFGRITRISLLELSDLNHPLLKRMVIEAPGTYHHSLMVSTLAESACETIGANGLLARVGSYFHDIGKMVQSDYFTENQVVRGKGNPHDLLSPEESFKIIAEHVSKGMPLAKKYNLPQVIIDFIPQHQGTYPAYYFYRKAKESADQLGREININDYRYPGPKPQSKETAVVMMADSVEAASRSIKDISTEAIDKLVTDIINVKFTDGQFDECDLTFRDLRFIQQSFVRSLLGIYHTRIQYPKSDAKPIWQKAVSNQSKPVC